MKVKNFNGTVRRRGTTIAAAALSVSLIAPFVHPIAAPQTAAVAQAQDASASETAGDAKIIDADAIASGQVTRASNLTDSLGVGKNVVSGRAQIINPVQAAQLTSTWDGFQPVPGNQKVYLQWIDANGAVSPVYSAVTHDLKGAGEGVYAFELPTWTDGAGKEHKFVAAASQRYRIWGEDFVNPETGNELRQLRSAPGYTPFTYGRGSGEGLGDFPGSAGTASNTAKTGIWFYEAPNDYVKSDNLVETTEDEFVAPAIVSPGKISGQVWLETDRNLENQLLSGATKNAKDPVASGSTVWASVLSDAGIQRNNEIWSLPAEQRASATKEMLQDKNNLAKTGYAVVNEDGKYTIDLGEDYDPDNLYMWVTDANGDVISTYSSFTQPVFTNPRKNLAWAPTSDPLVYRNYAYNVNFAAIALREASLDITNFDMTDKPAAPGATAKLELSGRLGEVDNVIEWRNSKGDALKSCDVASVSEPGDCATFEVPSDAKDGEVFHAVLISNGNEASADSFIVSLKTSVDDSGVKPVEPTADEQDSGIKVSNRDDDTKVSAKDEDGKDVPAKIDDNGNVVVTPGEDVDGPITVTVEDPDLDGGKAVVEVPVNGHKKGQDDNNSDKAPATSVDDSGVKPVEPTADEQDSGIKVSNRDDDTKVSAKDEDGKDVPAKIDDNGNVVVTPGEDVDGPITVTVEDPDLDGGKAVVEVPVNGHKKGQDDNNSDKTEEPGTNPTTPEGPKDTDGDGIPDSEDTDDDNDGVNDKDEEAAGLDPKNPDSDGDGTKDGDEDADGDGKTNAEESDADSDKITDKDGDKKADLIDEDNEDGPTGDKDGDGIENKDDADADGDGVNNDDEKEIGTDPLKTDSDGDGKSDGEEDYDKDGKSNAEESDVPEDGRADDTDNDGLGNPGVTDKGVNGNGEGPNGTPDIRETDTEEVAPKDTDGDGIPDSEDTDDDNDGVNDKDEEAAGLDPKNPDSDGDGTKDGEEDNDGDGKTNAEESDADSDKITDKDGNGVADLTEKDTDGDGIPDSEDTDIDGDGVNNEDEKAAGLNPEKKDSDGNGVEDGQEDSDDDGIKNADESDENSKTITDKNDNGVADLTEKPDDAAEKPSIDAGSTTDKVVADGESHELDDTVKNPTEGMTGEVIGENGKAIDGAEVTVDPETGEISVTVPEGTKAQNATVEVKDKDGKKVGDIDIEITEPKDNTGTGAAAGDDEGDESLSSKIGERCLATGLGAGIPLLFLIPVGLASQLNIPGLKEFVAPIDAQIQALNTQLQKQAGIFQGPLAGQAAAFDTQLKRFGLNASSIALIAAGALAIGLIADACTPGAGSSDGSSEGSSK
ncbi:hypothetical protein [Corynebacterium sp. LaCa116]|uniref:hypothetical protein n=1 Tax=Corynebacterium sp. LaCa116 TaxID=3391423 RepID=UPI003989F83C